MSGRATFVSFVAVAVLCTACGATQDPGASTIATTAPDSTTSTLEDIVTTSVPDVEALAIADLASRLGVETGSISTIRSEAKTWPDGSLGCPEPGMSYTQALVEGWQILLEYQDRVYDYHAGGGEPFLCPSPDKDGGYDFVPPPGFDD